ncbi:hypothetical protein [Salegentibacter salarius]|uniref:Uncharacterized protein n=1 Tax=Salegentibacter salarius TaxID=435906 RepID=A0A2N0U3C0_9FLAO|nr:hypothetical protein [Salegentibacter salarius]OEY71242.1 hypothetical protein BHS39_07140 [Salegentibacter salarius]PKD21396.1 hypothetical protein APR40_07135 [Salegentibacter salarius]SLJ92852.1 hypothetical protein SAMN05660445_01348 [Salegentibacter salarius]
MYKNYFLFFSFFIITLSTFSQNYSEEKIFSWYDQNIGIENTTLFQGIEYVETDRMINEKHKFFETQEFQKGSVTYNGQTFYEVPLKYNIYDDLLLVNLEQDQRNFIFQLIDNQVNQFQIDENKFRYLKSNNNSDILGFYEVINEEGAFKIFKKHLRNRMEIRDRSVAYSEFSPADPDYIFQFKDEFFELDNRRDVYSKFPDLKSEIRGFYSKYRKQSRNNPDLFMKNLANEINSLIPSATNQIQE